jgi:predicted aspartyl protease
VEKGFLKPAQKRYEANRICDAGFYNLGTCLKLFEGDLMSRTISVLALMSAACLIITGGVLGAAEAFQLNLEGGRLSVHAERVPLQTLLQGLSGYGISVRIDPQLNPSVSAAFENKELEEGLKSLIRPLNSIYIWKPGADVSTYRLAEVQVFKPGEKDRMVVLSEVPDHSAMNPPLEKHRESDWEFGMFETQVIIKADRVFVPVVLGYEDRKIETTLIFDTGANSIVIHQNVAEALGISAHETAKGYGVGGIEIDAQVTRLQSVRVGPFEKQNLRTAIVAYQGPSDGTYDGLLGMNFLRGLKYEIDFDAQVIRWAEGETR